MARVRGKSVDGKSISFQFHSCRAAERFLNLWNGIYDDGNDIYTLEVIPFV